MIPDIVLKTISLFILSFFCLFLVSGQDEIPPSFRSYRYEVTGSGLKDFQSAKKMCEKPPRIKVNLEEIESALKYWENGR